ncbi:MAG: SRPBCC family protein [Candidatus Alcyoniella australis]|nr:SRPBCC family protein [Candidatus Alcyoniella australis]
MAQRAEMSIEIDVPPKKVYEVISDFAAYPDFLSDVASTSIISQDKDEWEVEFGVKIIKQISYTLRLWGTPGKSLDWKLVKGFMKKNDGGWALESLDKGKRTKATYFVDVEFGLMVPKKIVNTVMQANFPTMLKAFKKRCEEG